MSREDLLKPTLSGYRRPPALYHSTGLALASFFGGPAGAVVYAGANTFRLGRLAQDLPVLLVLFGVAFLIPVELAKNELLNPIAAFFGGRPASGYEVVLRVLGLACFGAIYIMHRRFFRAARVAGVNPLPGWLPGAVAIVAGLVVNTFFIGWVLKHH